MHAVASVSRQSTYQSLNQYFEITFILISVCLFSILFSPFSVRVPLCCNASRFYANIAHFEHRPWLKWNFQCIIEKHKRKLQLLLSIYVVFWNFWPTQSILKYFLFCCFFFFFIRWLYVHFRSKNASVVVVAVLSSQCILFLLLLENIDFVCALQKQVLWWMYICILENTEKEMNGHRRFVPMTVFNFDFVLIKANSEQQSILRDMYTFSHAKSEQSWFSCYCYTVKYNIILWRFSAETSVPSMYENWTRKKNANMLFDTVYAFK